MFYEIGVLRAIDAHLEGASVVDFDVFSGISAGAIISAFIANGIKPYEIANALHGRPSRINPVTRFMLFDPNLGEVTKRILSSMGDLIKGKWLTNPIDSALKVTPTALFSGDKLRQYLKNELTRPGMCNNFDEIKKDLFIGATNQDSGTHVSFGTKGYTDVEISTAVRASAAMTPYYNPEKIGDNYFVDGIFTRTIDIDVAVAAGARLIICVDPLTPVQTDEAGYVSSKGGLFNTIQSVKSMIRTRFKEVIDRAEEEHPNVSVYIFSPTARDLEHMSGTMMRFFYRTETENMAYESATDRIETVFKWLKADFAKHGYTFKPPM
jgi:predicted acylesterase/phospholipase RssA